MMAGVVAMASVIEDFDTQPCKKSRKDEGSPVVKTITNYFSPVPKPLEKPFSPPRANNIMDYFTRKAPTKSSSPEQLTYVCQKSQLDETRSSSEAAVKPQKRSRKLSRAARKLVEAETVSSIKEDCCLIVEKQPDNRESTAELDGSCGVPSSDATALSVQFIPEACIKGEKLESSATDTIIETDEHHELSVTELSPVVPSKDKAKRVKTFARNSQKNQLQEANHSEPEEKETEKSLCDVSMEVNVDEASQLNSSTVTISFEEFVRSQSMDMDDDTDQLNIPKTEENVGFGEPALLHVSPRTVTIQAEVHVVSPKQEAVATGKLASIFNRRKGTLSPSEPVTPANIEGHQLGSTSLTVKRKSNVVLEEDLELVVLESESTHKCSEVERKQFMAAFKQASLEGSKIKPGKSQGKQKQPGEKVLDDTDKVTEEEGITPPSVKHVPTASQGDMVAKKTPARKGRKNGKETTEVAPTLSAASSMEYMAATTVVVDDTIDEPPMTSTPSIPAVRRSRREAVVKQTPKATSAATVRKTRKHSESKDVAAALPSPAEIRKSKRGVYVAEMVCPPDTQQSPIRMKFIRVNKNVPATKVESGCGAYTSLANKTSNDSKKRKQAKKLVQKARVIQQGKKAAVEKKTTLRRSTRTQASSKSYCEDEDSVICLEEAQTATPKTAPEKSKTQKSLRSLNDVLGKALTKPVSGSKGASVGQEKSVRKVSAVISIFDESSREGSETSQDDEPFRARREFLKSGLPESFRKQMAKTAATKEAYSRSCSFFQPVIHVKQPPSDCPLWSLLWPQSSLLCNLQELWYQTYRPLLPVSGCLWMKTEPAHRASYEQGSSRRPEISESVCELLKEEVGTCNPLFPVEKFITCFLKRRADHQEQCMASETITRVTGTTLPTKPAGGKRKRFNDEGEATAKVAKKQRANSSAEPLKRGSRMRRGLRSRPEEETSNSAKPLVKAANVLPADESVVVPLGEEIATKDLVKEDVLWTDKYQPQHSSDIIGNTASVRKLHSWLKEWKLHADREERIKQMDKKRKEGSNDSDWDCGEEDSQDGEDMLCNTVLITGPTGVGKTAAVYACAQELGFKVFEVNASSQRSGRLILSQLKEATQSHQVDSQGVNAHKPTYFNSYGTTSSCSSTGSHRPGSSPRKSNSPRPQVSSPRKHPQSPRGAKRGGLAPTSLANFFKIAQPTNNETLNTKKNEKTASAKNAANASECTRKHKEPAVNSPAAKEKNNEEQSKKTATSLILFEEVDVIFDDDSGFLAAIKTFMTTTKRPVILTTSDPVFSTMFDGNFEKIHFKAPSVPDASSFLRLLCLAEGVRTDQWDISALLRLNGCDMRQSLLQLQLWTRSGGGRYTTRPLSDTGKNEIEPKRETEDALCAVTIPSDLPPRDAGCTESMLGLLNLTPERNIWELLRSCSLEEALLDLLSNSRRRGVDLLYSNMEALLTLPVTQLTTSTYKPEHSVFVSQDPVIQDKRPTTCSQAHALPSHAKLLHTAESADCLDDSSPFKVSSRVRKTKRRHSVPEQDKLNSDPDSEDDFVSLRTPKTTPQTKEVIRESLVSKKVKRKTLTAEERLKSLPISQCLESVSDFLDNMSYVDSFLTAPREEGDSSRGTVDAVVKDGMKDELRVETERGAQMRLEHALEIPAAVEALSFHRCCVSVAEAWNKAQQLEGELGKKAATELTLPVAAHRDCYSFSQDSHCQPQLVQQRREVMENLMFRGVFGTLSNRPAAALDYLPALRTICRSQQLKEQGKVKRRFLHYLDTIHLGLEKRILQHLSEDFP